MADENVGGIAVGSFGVGTLLYVDDMILLCTNDVETTAAHLKAVGFSVRKRLKFSHKKCFLLVAFKKKQDEVPKLEIDGSPVAVTNVVKVLGDLFNDKGNNKDLINDRIQRGNSCTVNSISLCNELSLGRYMLNTLIVLYGAVFLPSVLFNSEAWSDLKKSELSRLQVVQLKFLKRAMKVPSSCPNAGTFLEFGKIPIEGEIHSRQLSFLHHILSLDASDPVYRMYVELKSFEHETNWANDMKNTLQKYSLVSDEQEIKKMGKEKWKTLVKQKVESFWFDYLVHECGVMKKTQHLKYDKLKGQEYLTSMSPQDAQIIFRARLGCINCKGNMPSAHRGNLTCRLCKMADETQEHILNCPVVRGSKDCLDISIVLDISLADSGELVELCSRVRSFDNLISKCT